MPTNGMAGNQDVAIGPYTSSTTFTDGAGGASSGNSAWDPGSDYADIEDAWTENGVGLLFRDDDDDEAEIVFGFRFYINKGSNTYVSGPTTGKITLVYYWTGSTNIEIKVKDQESNRSKYRGSPDTKQRPAT